MERYTRAIIRLTEVIIGLLLITASFFHLAQIRLLNIPLTLIGLALGLYTVIAETRRIMSPSTFGTKSALFSSLRVRACLYQAIAYLLLGQTLAEWYDQWVPWAGVAREGARYCDWLAWGTGVALVFMDGLASATGYSDWLEEEPGWIGLDADQI